MNPFSLFENENLDDIKLGLKVIKSLGLEKEFENYVGISHQQYSNVFYEIVIPMVDTELKWLIPYIFEVGCKVDDLDIADIYKILINIPKSYKYFNLDNLNVNIVYWTLLDKPELIEHLPYNKLADSMIIKLLGLHPHLIIYLA